MNERTLSGWDPFANATLLRRHRIDLSSLAARVFRCFLHSQTWWRLHISSPLSFTVHSHFRVSSGASPVSTCCWRRPFFHSHSSPMPVVFVAMQLSFMRRRVRHSSISFLTPRKYTSTHESSRRNTNCAASPSNPSPTNKVKVLRHDFRSVLLYDSWLFLVWSFSRARRLRCHLVIAESCVYNWVYAWNLMENW